MARYNKTKLLQALERFETKQEADIQSRLEAYDTERLEYERKLAEWCKKARGVITETAAKITDDTVTCDDLIAVADISIDRSWRPLMHRHGPFGDPEYSRQGLESQLRAQQRQLVEAREALEALQEDENDAVSLTVQELRALGLSWLVAGR